MPGLDPNSPSQVAHAIASMCDTLEEATETYRVDLERAARSDSAYKLMWSMSLVAVAAENRGTKITVGERDALVEIATNEQRVIAAVHEAQAKATKEKLNSLRVELDAARSLGANLRALI